MPLSTPFCTYAPEKPPDLVGVYELAWKNHPTYIGSGVIRDRLRAHDRDPAKKFRRYRCLIVSDRRRARQIERREQRRYANRHGELPKYNERIG